MILSCLDEFLIHFCPVTFQIVTLKFANRGFIIFCVAIPSSDEKETLSICSCRTSSTLNYTWQVWSLNPFQGLGTNIKDFCGVSVESTCSKKLRLKTERSKFSEFCLCFACFDVMSQGASTQNSLGERKEQMDRLTGYLLAPSCIT